MQWLGSRSSALLGALGIALSLLTFSSSSAQLAPSPIGVQVHFQLPTDGVLPRTYRVTLAAVDPKEPTWIISTFAAGLVCTVTSENHGRFEAVWDGLDDNAMPVPPGTYALKGIYMPARIWPIDGLSHSIVPKLAAMAASWGQSPAQDALPSKMDGDPVGEPLADVDVAANGIGSVYFSYLENGSNYFLTDFNRPIGYNQIITGYSSGVFAGGGSTCTDGHTIWSFSTDGGPKFIGRADGRPFGSQNANRHGVYLPEGWVTALAAWPNPQTGRTVVFAAERGEIISSKSGDYFESASEPINEVVALDGEDAHLLATWKTGPPLALAARADRLFVLESTTHGSAVLSLPLTPGWAQARLSPLFSVPPFIHPFDLEADHRGRIYLSDSAANHVYQLDSQGRLLRTYGRLNAPIEGRYDPNSFMSPRKLACWTDATGQDRLLVVENSGPNRLSEWSGDHGNLLRQWVTPQTKSNDGYAVDPRHPDRIYLPGHEGSLVRWRVNYTTGQWTPEAVWSHLVDPNDSPSGLFGGHLLQGLASPRLIYHANNAYLVFNRGYAVFRLEGERFRPCAAILHQSTDSVDHTYLWRDLNGDGRVQLSEYLPFPITLPPGTNRYFGETFADDLSLIFMGQGTDAIWQLSPTAFDRLGNPLYAPAWKKIITDPTFVARKAGLASATHGGNEVADNFDSDWAMVAPSPSGDIYVSARSGPNFSSNVGAQYKLSRYVPDGRGGYSQRWRVGRIALQGDARPGEVYGPIHVSPPLNGLIAVIDNNRAGVVLYTEDGLYVDTLFPDARIVSHDQMGAYWQPGEFFAGFDYLNRDNGKIYLALGKLTPELYEAQGWSATENPVKPLTSLDPTVSLEAAQIASPPEVALMIRGGAAAARVARFYPATGGPPALDGSLRGWEHDDPVRFAASATQTVEARCAYDPAHLYLRWHVRLGHEFKPHPLLLPQHVFAHDQGNDTVSLYLQGDPHAPLGSHFSGGRPGDVRFVCGLFRDQGQTPVVLGMYPTWSAPGGSPQTYATPVGSVSFANVAIVPGVSAGSQVDADHRGFVLAVAIPRAAIPGLAVLNGWRTEGNFDANLSGLDRFWWSNADGSASRETFDEPTEARFDPGSWSPVQCVPIDHLPLPSWMAIGPFGFAGIDQHDLLAGRDQIVRTLLRAQNPPDTLRDLSATYQGALTRTRVAQRTLSWKAIEASGDSLDIAQALGWNGYNDEGTFYLLTHLYSPRPAHVYLHLALGDGAVYITGQLNGRPLPENSKDNLPDEAQPLALQAGWNELLLRRTVIWGEMNYGVTLTGDPAVLWQLRFRAAP